MDQSKIGRYIAEKRKNRNLTQMQLAEKLGITDRAVSKWETGKSLPDASLMLELCELLGISVNELLCGEDLTMDTNTEKTEKNLIEMIRQKESSDRKLLNAEIVMGVVSCLFLAAMLALAIYFLKESIGPDWIAYLLMGVGFVQFLVVAVFALRIEQSAGYYECAECGHRYVPSLKNVILAQHMGRTRLMKCPICGKKSWQKKVLRKE